ncbi:sugar kinase [Streptomyces sp. CA2R106]|uniref:sugar kinase n=1 Tax=Streptomyces sp. CA2R106 TaxID=3120153 RepID=UPI00300B0C56
MTSTTDRNDVTAMTGPTGPTGPTHPTDRTDLTVLGETMASLTPDHIGPLRHARGLGLSVAGSESTVAIGAARLGHRAAWIGRVGDDELGRTVLNRLRGENLLVHAVTDPEAPTGLMLKERPAAGHSRVHYYRAGSAGSRLHPDDLPGPLLERTRVLHTTGITLALSDSARTTAHEAMRRTRAAGGTVSFDLNHRARLWSKDTARAALTAVLPLVDLLFASVDEAVMVTGRPDLTPAQTGQQLLSHGPGTVVLTDGAAGAVCITADRTIPVAAVPVQAVDPVGAGDAFVAGCLSGFLAGLTTEEALARAAAVAALCVASEGDWEGLPEPDRLPQAAHRPGTVLR